MLGIIITCYKDNNHKYQDNNPNNLKSNPNKSIKLNHIKSKQKYIDMKLLWKPYKHNIKYKRYRQLGIRFLRENLAQAMEKKNTRSKTYQSKSTIRNQVTQIYLTVLP